MNKKQLLALLLSFALVLSLSVPALAASTEAIDAANALHALGLFNGTGTDASGNPIYDLDRTPTRNEAATMLVRLLGKEAEATSGNWNAPFTDVVDWAVPYVGYAYANGIVNGTSETTFSGNDPITASQYLTLVLRALGYQSGTDFQWDKAWEFSDQIGLTKGEYNAGTATFTRGDVAVISHRALYVTLKGNSTTLISLVQSGNKSSVETKVEILRAFSSAAEIQKKGAEQALAEMNKVPEEYWTNAYLVTVFQEYQNNCRPSIDYLNYAIDLCGTYSDTQEMKKYLGELTVLFSSEYNYNITAGNFPEFLNASAELRKQREIVSEKIQGEMNRWTAEIE